MEGFCSVVLYICSREQNMTAQLYLGCSFTPVYEYIQPLRLRRVVKQASFLHAQ